jgi:hypothetical protein
MAPLGEGGSVEKTASPVFNTSLFPETGPPKTRGNSRNGTRNQPAIQ